MKLDHKKRVYLTDQWTTDAHCKNYPTDLWFPAGTTKHRSKQTQQAIDICYHCPVIQQCAQNVLNMLEAGQIIRDGIWAGIEFTDNTREAYNHIQHIAENGNPHD